MPALRNYNVFISHAWKYNDDYYRLEKWLHEYPNFVCTNLSVPEHDPIANVAELKYHLHKQMRPAHVFIILSGMYVAHSDWIQYEINFARWTGRPIIGIRPWGSSMVPVAVQNAAVEIVGWNSDSIVTAIRRRALMAGAASA